MPDLRLVGRERDHIVRAADGSVEIHAPTADLSAQALVSGKSGLLVPKERAFEYENGEPRCIRCKGGDVVLQIEFPGEDGHPLNLCRECVTSRPRGNPIRIDMEMLG